jgi:hypothetical protein
MKLSELRKRIDELTGKASEIVRQLVLAGIAIIWLFRGEKTNTLDSFAVIPMIILGLAVLVDLSQYVVSAHIWLNFYLKERKKYPLPEDPDVRLPNKYGRRLYAVFLVKIGLMIIAYVFLIILVIRNITLK